MRIAQSGRASHPSTLWPRYLLVCAVLSASGVLCGACSAPWSAGRASSGAPVPVVAGSGTEEAELEVSQQMQEAPYEGDLAQGDLVRADGEFMAPRAPLVATAEPAKANTPVAPTTPPSQAPRVDAQHTGPLLIYTAAFQLHVYEVEKAQTELKAAAKRLGGFVSEQTDTALILRVPSAHFEEAIAAIESTGKVRARHVQALDVGDQYRDLTLRLRTAEALRDRLEVMLARAAKVEEALHVERELERIVREIEQLKGQLRSMGDRIVFSTLSVDFRPEQRPDLDDSDAFRLPYAWLEELGLHHLLELTP
jgi:hypothetical protein